MRDEKEEQTWGRQMGGRPRTPRGGREKTEYEKPGE